MDEREQVAAHPAQVRRGDGDGRVRCDGGIDGVAAEHQRSQTRLRRQLVGAGNQTLRRADRVESGEAMPGTYAFPVQRNLIGRAVVDRRAAVALLGTFLPWLRSGSRRRNSYEIFSLVERLGISQSSLVGWGLRVWPVAPFLLVAAVTLQWFPRTWLTGVVRDRRRGLRRRCRRRGQLCSSDFTDRGRVRPRVTLVGSGRARGRRPPESSVTKLDRADPRAFGDRRPLYGACVTVTLRVLDAGSGESAC